jgi:hypothetical protein
MPVDSQEDRLRKVLISILNWIDTSRGMAKTPSDVSFLVTSERYARNTLNRLSRHLTSRELRKLKDRVEKLQSAVIFYVQRQFR